MKSSNKIKLYVFFIFSTLFVYSQNLTIESGGSSNQNKSLTVSGSVTRLNEFKFKSILNYGTNLQ